MEVMELHKGERTMSKAFIAQYAAEASQRVDGVAFLDTSTVTNLKEALGFEHEGHGVLVNFSEGDSNLVCITVYPIIYFGEIVPEVSRQIQEKVKEAVELYTDLICEEVNVHVKNIVPRAWPEK